MIDSLAEHVPCPVRTKTRGRSSVGSGCPAVVEALRRSVERRRRDGLSSDRIGRRVLVVELDLLERASGGRHRPGDHVGELAGDVEIAAAVVADVEHEIDNALPLESVDRVDQLLLRGGNMVVELKVTHDSARGCDGLDVLDGCLGYVGSL